MNSQVFYLKLLCGIVAGILTLSSPLTAGAQCPPGAIFCDSFESGDLSATNSEGFKWGGTYATKVISQSQGASGSSASEWKAYSGEHALRFLFKADKFMSEQRFDLGMPHRELWISFWLRVPVNFKHGSNSPTNNKLLAIWSDDYSQKGDGSTVFWSFWNTGNGSSKTSIAHTVGGYKASGSQTQFSHFITYPDDQGAWMHLVFHVKAESITGKGDGMIEMWRRWGSEMKYKKIHEMYDVKLKLPSDGPHGFQKGYLLGWSNSGYEQDTEWLIDDVVFSEHNLLIDHGQRPSRPVLMAE